MGKDEDFGRKTLGGICGQMKTGRGPESPQRYPSSEDSRRPPSWGTTSRLRSSAGKEKGREEGGRGRVPHSRNGA